MSEVKANMAFGYHRQGDRFQVDVDDPRVQGLIKGGYVTLIEEAPDGSLDDTSDPAWADCLFSDDLVAGTVQTEEEAVDEPGADLSDESDSDSA